MNRFRFFSCIALFLSLNVSANINVSHKDLALIFPINEDNLIKVDDRISGQTLFPRSWYDEVINGFKATNVGDALYQENYFSDWSIVGIRIVPCSTSQNHVSASNNEWCWPEIRIVWQPIIYNLPMGWQRFNHFADDRAIHTLYDIDPSLYLNAADATRAKALLALAKAGTLSTQDKSEYVALARQVSAAYLLAVKALRLNHYQDNAYDNLGFRPETTDSSDATLFYQRLKPFLLSHAAPSRIKALTAFSLPEGRQPALIDEWIFLSFEGANGNITPTDITVHDHNTGELIINLGQSQIATTAEDDERVYRPGIVERIRDSAILIADDFDRLRPVISDRTQRLVPNTTCASCHKLNNTRFNFHNMSYLQDRFEMTISPRVEMDVLHDLNWIDTHLTNVDLPGDNDDDGNDDDGSEDDSSTNPEPQRFENSTRVTIPDNSSAGVASSINATLTERFTTVTITLSIKHTYIGDLEVDLQAPDGTRFLLHQQQGGSANDLNLAKSFDLNNVAISGVWQLRAKDLARQDTGFLEQWSLTFE